MTCPVTSDMTEPMLQLYSFQLCPFAHRVRLALAEKGVAAEPIGVDLKNKPASFARISPHGRVPLLLHGEVKLWESAIINEYLDEVFPDPPLMPASLADRALARSGSSLPTIAFIRRRTASSSHGKEEARRKLVARCWIACGFSRTS
jgi:glutathione S-transferase